MFNRDREQKGRQPEEQTTTYREAVKEDADFIVKFVETHGKHKFFDFSTATLKNELGWIGEGYGARIARRADEAVGVITYFKTQLSACSFRHHLPWNFKKFFRIDEEVGYIAVIVVHERHRGQGIALQLYTEAIEDLRHQGIKSVYVKRHEENVASKKAMEKVGFKAVAVYQDGFRTSGSGRTVVSKLDISSIEGTLYSP